MVHSNEFGVTSKEMCGMNECHSYVRFPVFWCTSLLSLEHGDLVRVLQDQGVELVDLSLQAVAGL